MKLNQYATSLHARIQSEIASWFATARFSGRNSGPPLFWLAQWIPGEAEKGGRGLMPYVGPSHDSGKDISPYHIERLFPQFIVIPTGKDGDRLKGRKDENDLSAHASGMKRGNHPPIDFKGT
jgi:hypothetical protein